MIDITDKNLEKSYNQVKNEMARYSKKLLNKKEIIILNKIDLLKSNEVDKIIKKFAINKKCEILLLTTLKKTSISNIKAKLLNYVS